MTLDNDIKSKLDPAVVCLLEAEEIYNERVYISPYEALFEAGSKDLQEKEDKNAEVSARTSNKLAEACKHVIDFIAGIITSITNFIQEMFMSGAEYKKYQEYKQALKEHPELKNIKIKVKDFREANKVYDDYMDKIDEKIRSKTNGSTDLEKFMGECSNVVKANAAATTKILTLEAALNYCASNRDAAKAINSMLKDNQYALEEIKNTLGEKRAKKYMKEMDIFASEHWIPLRRFKATLGKKKADSIAESCTNVLSEVGKVLNGKIDKGNKNIVKDFRNNEDTSKTISTIINTTAGEGIKSTAAYKNTIGKAEKAGKNLSKKVNGRDIDKRIKIF